MLRSGGQNLAAQRGAALILLLLILVVGAASLFTSRLAQRSSANLQIQQHARALADAKQALLGYALTYYDTNPGEFGFLPCPDINNGGPAAEGEEHAAACGAQYATAMGRLPWKTLGLTPATRDGGECIWYAVSGTHKNATGAKAEMLNTDTNGLLQVFAANGTTSLTGATPDSRAVAVLFAPGIALGGQSRTPLGFGVGQCGGNYTPTGYLDNANGIDNAALSGLADTIDPLIARGNDIAVNDQVLFITRDEIEQQLARRSDTQIRLQQLTQAVAECIADYGNTNPGGANDLRLPWPAPVNLADYRAAGNYDDSGLGILSGRVPDVVDDSNAQTLNPITNVVTGCNALTVPSWTAEMATLWAHWKDHLFVAVADGFKPDATTPTACGTCLSVNGAGNYAAVILFSGRRLAALNQLRDAPPVDTDTKSTIGNYLEDRNASNHPNLPGNGDYESATASANFNDVLYCIDPAMSVSPC